MTWNTSNKQFNFDSVYTALISLAQSIEDPPEEIDEDPEAAFKLIEAGQPDNISLYQGDLVIIGLGKITQITKAMGGRAQVAHVNGAYLIMVEGTSETSQRRASHLWERLFAAVGVNSKLNINNCKCRVNYDNPGGMRQFDTNLGTKNKPNYCAGAVLNLQIQKAREIIETEEVEP